MIIQNLESISVNQRRKKILNALTSVFDELDPAAVCRKEVESLDIPVSGKLYIIGFGKAAYRMYSGVRSGISRKIDAAWIVVPDDQQFTPEYEELEVLYGSHPITSEKSVESTEKIISSVGGLSSEDVVLVLISGGGSALFEKPVEGVGIQQIASASQCLMDADADILELNTFRRHFSMVKGGKLARYLHPAKVYSLLISDVYGDDPAFVASGPLTFPSGNGNNLSTLIEKYGVKCPILKDMERNAEMEELNPDDMENVHQKIVLRNRDFVESICSIFVKWGVDYVNLGSNVNGNVKNVSRELMDALKRIWELKRSGFWFVLGGETTVNVTGEGMGGRNQEMALRMLQSMKKEDFVFTTIGTDGVDGKSPAMGAIVDTDLRERISNDEIEEYLDASDSYSILSKYGSAIITGPTGNNVSDVTLGYFDFEH